MRLQARLARQLGGPREGPARLGAGAEAELDPPLLVVGPREVGRAAQQLAQLARGGPQLARAAQRLGQAEAGQRRVGVEVEVTAQQPALGGAGELAVGAEQLLLKLALLVVQHRDLAEQREHQQVDAGAVGQALAVLLDEHDVGALGVRVGAQHQHRAVALADRQVVPGDPLARSQLGGDTRQLGQRPQRQRAGGQLEAVPLRPQQAGRGRQLAGRERGRIRGLTEHVQAVGRVAQAVLDAVDVVLDAAPVLGAEARRPAQAVRPAHGRILGAVRAVVAGASGHRCGAF